jgi:hypothetical protein
MHAGVGWRKRGQTPVRGSRRIGPSIGVRGASAENDSLVTESPVVREALMGR